MNDQRYPTWKVRMDGSEAIIISPSGRRLMLVEQGEKDKYVPIGWSPTRDPKGDAEFLVMAINAHLQSKKRKKPFNS